MKVSKALLVVLMISMLFSGCITFPQLPPGHVAGYVYIPGPEYVLLEDTAEVLFSTLREPPRGYIPLVDASVQIDGKYGFTDRNGLFQIRNIRPGTRTLIVAHPVLRSPIRKSVRIESDEVVWFGLHENGPLFGGVGYFIVIGIGDYPDRRIPGVVENAERVYDELFLANGLAAFGAKLINREATKKRIKGQIELAIDYALSDSHGNSDDYLVIYFAGKSGADYISPVDDDGRLGWRTAITDAELEEWLRPFPGSVTLIIDGTESATMADGDPFAPLALRKRKYAVISAARENEEVFYEPSLNGSVFTHFLLRGLKSPGFSADRDGDGDITARELYDYLHDNMKKYFNGWTDRDSHKPDFYGGDHAHGVVFRYSY